MHTGIDAGMRTRPHTGVHAGLDPRMYSRHCSGPAHHRGQPRGIAAVKAGTPEVRAAAE